MTINLNIAQVFHSSPSGRDASHGDWHGERFRKEFLLPPIKQDARLVISLKGLTSLSPSFFEEAFGGLYREDQITSHQKLNLNEIITFIDIGSIFRQKIWNFINGEISKERERFLDEWKRSFS